MIRLTKTGFRQWLVKNKKVLVGRPNEMNICPFCKFLKSRGVKSVSFPTTRYRIVNGRTIKNTEWQRKFQLQAISKEKALDVVGLRGREALQVLDEL